MKRRAAITVCTSVDPVMRGRRMSLLQAWLVINTQCLVSTFDEQVDGLSGIKSDQKSMSVDLCEVRLS